MIIKCLKIYFQESDEIVFASQDKEDVPDLTTDSNIEHDEDNILCDITAEDQYFEEVLEDIFNDDSDIEIEMEDLNQQTENNEDDLEPLYPGASISLGAVMLLLSLFVTKHSLVGDGIHQLLKIISLILPDGHKLYTSIQSFRMYFQNLRTPLVKHHYCGHCLGSIRNPNEKVCPY